MKYTAAFMPLHAVLLFTDFFLSMKRKEPQPLASSSDTFFPSSHQALNQVPQRVYPSQQALLSSAGNGDTRQPPTDHRPQAYAALSQSDGGTYNYRRNSRDGDAADAGQPESGRSSRGSSVGAEVGVVDEDGRFISSLLSAQQARMRVYV
jgi:hypothetical protein